MIRLLQLTLGWLMERLPRGRANSAAFFGRGMRGTDGLVTGAIILGAASLAKGLLNKKKAPDVVPYKEVNAQDEQSKAIKGNIAAEPDIEQLLTRSNRYQQGQQNDLMEQALPGYGKLSQTLLGQYQKQASNPYDLPDDVTQNLTRLSAERGINRGTSGQTNSYDLLRDFGINSMQYGQSNLTSALGGLSTLTGIAPKVSAASPLSFYLSPQQQIAVTTDNNTKQQQILQGGANAKTGAANANTQNLWDGIMGAAGAFAGVAGGGSTVGSAIGAFGGTGSQASRAPTGAQFGGT